MNYKKFSLATVCCLISMSSGSLGVEMSPVTVTDKLKADFMWRQDFHSWLSRKWKEADIKENLW